MGRCSLHYSVFFILMLWVMHANAGGNLVQLDPNNVTQVIEKKWDDRMLPINWVFSSDGNPGSGMTNQQIVNAFSAAFNTWQNVSTSDLTFQYGGEVNRRSSGLAGPFADGVDGYNLVTFTDPDVVFPPGVVGLALTFSFDTDVTINNANNDLDGDGSPDLANGLYPKGTIFDGDIIFNSALNYSLTGANGTLDIEAIALHEIGHFFGLSHSSIDGAVMYPFLDNDVTQARIPKPDDLGYASLFYPQEPAFSATYGIITGTITNGFDNVRVLGAHVFAFDSSTGTKVAGAYSSIDGSYRIPVPAGSYLVGIEPLDGDPPALNPARINEVIAGTFDTYFTEEFFDANESSVEADPLAAAVVTVSAGVQTTAIDIVTNTVDVPGISLVLDVGPNYISYPVQVPLGIGAFDLLQALGSSTEITAIDRFNRETGLFERASYVNGTPSGVNFSIAREESYLVHAKTQKAATFSGVPDCPDISVAKGLNLIAVPCPPATYSAFDLLQNLGSEYEVLSVQRYDPLTQNFETAQYSGGLPGGTDFPIYNGEGYLVEMAVDKAKVTVPGQGQIFPPAITGISPGRGIPGSNVLIIGQGFASDPADNLVVFNGVGSQVTYATPTVLTVKVPSTATSGPVTVTVDDKASNSIEFVVEPLTINENPQGETEILSGQTAAGELGSNGEQDRYTFLALKDSLATISAQAVVSGSPDLMLVLEGPSGVYLVSDDDSGGNTNPLINNYKLPETGVYTIVVTSVSGSSLGQYNLSLDINSATQSTRLTALNGGVQSGLAGTALATPFEVLLTSSAGLPLSGVPLTFTATNVDFASANSTDAGLINAGSTTVTTNGNGLATVTATLPATPGTFNIVVTAAGVPGATPVTLRVGSTATAVTDVVVSGNNQNCGGSGCQVNTALPTPYKLRFLDSGGNPVNNVLTAWAVVSGGGSITPAGTQTTTASGEAQVTHTLGSTLYFSDTTVRVPQSVAATVPGQATPVLFGSTAKAGAPATIVQNRTDFSRMTANTGALNAIHITVQDSHGNPVEGATVSSSSSALTVAPGLFEAAFFPDFKTNARGIWVGSVTAASVTPTIDEFGNAGASGLASTYHFNVNVGSASASYNVDVDLGPNMVTASQQGASAQITKTLGTAAKVLFRYQRRDSYPGSGNDDDAGDWTNETNFSPSNLRYVPIDGVAVNLKVQRQDGKNETSIGETATTINGQPQLTVTTDAAGLAAMNVVMGGVAGAISIVGDIPGPVTVNFKHDNAHPGQDGAAISSQNFTDEKKFAETTSIRATAPQLKVTIDDTNGLASSEVSGIALGSILVRLNGATLYDADGTTPDYNKFPYFARIALDSTEQVGWPSGTLLTNGGIGKVDLYYIPTGSQLTTGSNTLTVESGLKDAVGNEKTAAENHTFNF